MWQRVALSTVVNICNKLPSECTEPFMLAVPSLCNLLQNEDRQVCILLCVHLNVFCIFFFFVIYRQLCCLRLSGLLPFFMNSD